MMIHYRSLEQLKGFEGMISGTWDASSVIMKALRV